MTLNPHLLTLAQKVGVRVSERSCEDTYVFDGDSIATHYFKYKWQGPVATEEYLRSSEVVHFTTHDILHEIMHFVAAAPEQRDLPEFGLGYVYLNGGNLIEAPCVVDPEEAERQEILTQLLCIQMGGKYGLSPKLSGEPETWAGNRSWHRYLETKNQEHRGGKWTYCILFPEAEALIQKWSL